jgi:Flp pilus assembly pilin Flp
MDRLRAAATGVVERAARSWPLVSWRGATARFEADDHDAQRGQGLAEYALILALIAIIAISSMIFLGETISDLFWDPIDEQFGKVLSSLGI